MTDEVIKGALDEYGKAFEEFKKANDEKLEQLEKGLSVDPLLNDKIENIEEKMNGLEDFNQRFTQAEKAQEQVNEKLSSLTLNKLTSIALLLKTTAEKVLMHWKMLKRKP